MKEMLAQSDNKIQIEVFGLLADLKYQIARCCAEVSLGFNVFKCCKRNNTML